MLQKSLAIQVSQRWQLAKSTIKDVLCISYF
jgi:hypothetical protein